MKQMTVHKTLVVGLGSTGTEIINTLIDRIEWELGSIKAAPWIRFLALETNGSTPTRLEPTDFRRIELTTGEYAQLLNNPQAFDQTINLSAWQDRKTLEQLPGSAVGVGAGHIRMVGRLALLFPKNFQMVWQALTQRMSELRQLTKANLSDAVSFADANGEELKVFVVGTLAGGTCSGTAGDLGIMLRMLAKSGGKTHLEHVYGMFTIPHAGHSGGAAETHKANAYHALLELNQYQNHMDPHRYTTIRYPNAQQPVLKDDDRPYDAIYLLRAQQNTPDELARLTPMAADRIFLNIFVSHSDPAAKLVDVPPPPRDGLTFSFSTFGMSSIEYPVRRIYEAAKARVLSQTLKEWFDPRGEGINIPVVVQQVLKLTPQGLLEDLLADDGGSSVRNELDRLRREVVTAARRNPQDVEERLKEWRSAFDKTWTTGSEGTRGLITRRVFENKGQVNKGVVARLLAELQKGLANFVSGAGPLALEDLVKEARRSLADMRGMTPKAVSPTQVDDLLRRLRIARSSPLLGAFFLRQPTVESMIRPLEAALRSEEQARLEHKLSDILQDGPAGAVATPGLLSDLEVVFDRVVTRFANLRYRVGTYAKQIESSYLKLDGPAGSDFNGVSLYVPGPNGTLEKAMAELLPEKDLFKLKEQLVARLGELAKDLVGSGQTDWLMPTYNPLTGESAISQEYIDLLEREIAASSLANLRSANVDLEARIKGMASPKFNPSNEVVGAGSRASLLLNVLDVTGQHSPIEPIRKKKVMLADQGAYKSGDLVDNALSNWINSLPPAEVRPISDPFRIVLLEEWHRFSLMGSEDVEILGTAQTSPDRIYFTRKRLDIDWTPIRTDERADLAAARRYLYMALLHEVVRVGGADGLLEMDWTAKLGVTATKVHLPRALERAARMLAFSGTDAHGLPMADAATVLQNWVRHRIEALVAERGYKGYVEYVRERINSGPYKTLPGWETDKAVEAFMKWFEGDKPVMAAVLEVFPPDKVMIEGLKREAGAPKPQAVGGAFDAPGYYCRVCGGKVGSTFEEAAANVFRCEYFPDDEKHPFGAKYDIFPGIN